MLMVIGYPLVLLLELCGLFAVWNWSIKRRSPGWLVAGAGLLIGLLLTLVLLAPHLSVGLYLGFAGMYVLSGLMWGWWMDDLHSADWEPGECGLAGLAAVMFAVAIVDG